MELSEALLAQKIYTIGTMQCHRGEPLEIWSSQNLVKHDIIARSNRKVTVLAWKDKRIVKSITTKHDNSMFNSVTRRKKEGHGEREQIQKPICVCDYNKYLSGVHHVDQMISYYLSTRKTLKWTNKMFFYLMKISVANAYVLYQAKSSMLRMTLYDFHLILIFKMCQKCLECGDILSSDDEGGSLLKSSKYPPLSRLHGGFKHHQTENILSTATRKYPERACKLCWKNGIRKDMSFTAKNVK